MQKRAAGIKRMRPEEPVKTGKSAEQAAESAGKVVKAAKQERKLMNQTTEDIARAEESAEETSEKTAQEDSCNFAKTGRYHNDYSPRYHEPFDIYEKARRHVRELKKKK